jgi:hypothetical protein
MKNIIHKYTNIDDKEKAIDRVWDYMDKHKIDISDYRTLTHIKDNVFFLQISLGIRIQYRDNIENEIKALL